MDMKTMRFCGLLISVFLFALVLPSTLAAQEPDLPLLVQLPQARPLEASVGQVTSNSVLIKWTPVSGQKSVSISISAEAPEKGLFPTECRKKTAELAGPRVSYEISHLAPGVDVFILVEAGNGQDKFAAYLHAKTVGGQGAKPASSLREVYMAAPDVLAVVVAGGNGQALQNSKWSVTGRDGTPLEVQKIKRWSVPVSAPEYFIGPNKPNRDDVILTDHHIFLNLGRKVGSREVLEIKGPAGISFTLPFSDKYLQTPVIQVNQVGYNPWAGKRYAYVYSYMGDGGVSSLTNFPSLCGLVRQYDDELVGRPLIFDGLRVAERRQYDDDAGGTVREINLGIVPPAKDVYFRIRLPGIGVSYRTTVSEQGVFEAYYKAARGLFHNRWGQELKAQHTDWPRPADHPVVYIGERLDITQMYPKDAPKNEARSIKGGYHDAADFDQRPMHTMIPMLLMSLYEMHPDRFVDNQLTLPESGNGIPDLLDEALWGIAAWEQLQEEDGGVRMGIESWSHPPGYFFASDDPLTYWTYARHPNISALAAGLFAQSARLLKKFDATRSDSLRRRALKAYDYAKRNAAAPAYMLYAAGELLLISGDMLYKRDFEVAWKAMGPYGAFNKIALQQPSLASFSNALDNRGEGFAMFDYLTAYYKSPHASPEIKTSIRDWVTRYSDNLVDTALNAHAFRNPRAESSPMGWGQGSTMGKFLDMVIMALRLDTLPIKLKQDILDVLNLSYDYTMGCNPAGRVYYTGMGSRNVRQPLHLDSLVWIKMGREPVPGIPAFGPIDGPPGSAWSQPALNAFYPSMNEVPHALRYADVRVLVECNESTVWENYAPNIKLFGSILRPGLTPPEYLLPKGAKRN